MEEKQEVEVPNLIGMTEKEANKIIEQVGLSLEIKEKQENNEKNTIESDDGFQNLESAERTITEQLPKSGIKIKQGTSVVGYVN